MYVYIYVYIHICTTIYICIYIHICTYIYIYREREREIAPAVAAGLAARPYLAADAARGEVRTNVQCRI